MDEQIAPHLKGYRGDGPVRIGNAAALQAQHDTYGSIILAAMPMFFDRRLPQPGDEALFRCSSRSAPRPSELALKPDAGIWEFRGRQQRAHPFRRDVLGRHQPACGDRRSALSLPDRAAHWNGEADQSACRADGKGLEREAQGFHRGVSIPTTSMPACCCCPSSG